MKAQILHSLRSRFAGVEDRKELALATILDPRFKDKFFGGNIIKVTTKEWLLEEMTNVTMHIPVDKMHLPVQLVNLTNNNYLNDPLIDYKK